QYSPSSGARKVKKSLFGAAVSLHVQPSLGPLTYSCTSRRRCRSASPRSILRRNCCLLVNCILAGAAGVAGAVAAAAGTGGNDCAWTVETNRSNAVGTRHPTRPWLLCPPARLPLLLSPFCLMLFAIMIPLPLVWKPSLAPPVGPGPRRSRLCGTEATA